MILFGTKFKTKWFSQIKNARLSIMSAILLGLFRHQYDGYKSQYKKWSKIKQNLSNFFRIITMTALQLFSKLNEIWCNILSLVNKWQMWCYQSVT